MNTDFMTYRKWVLFTVFMTYYACIKRIHNLTNWGACQKNCFILVSSALSKKKLQKINKLACENKFQKWKKMHKNLITVGYWWQQFITKISLSIDSVIFTTVIYFFGKFFRFFKFIFWFIWIFFTYFSSNKFSNFKSTQKLWINYNL